MFFLRLVAKSVLMRGCILRKNAMESLPVSWVDESLANSVRNNLYFPILDLQQLIDNLQRKIVGMSGEAG